MAGSFTNLLVHIVFSTKNRDPIIKNDFKDDLYSYIGGIIKSEAGKLICIGGMPDHIHLLVKYKQAQSMSDLVRIIEIKQR